MLFFNYFKTKCICVYIGYVLLTAGAHGGKKHWKSSELELQAVVSYLMRALVLKSGFAARVVCAVNHLSHLYSSFNVLCMTVWSLLSTALLELLVPY